MKTIVELKVKIVEVEDGCILMLCNSYTGIKGVFPDRESAKKHILQDNNGKQIGKNRFIIKYEKNVSVN